MDNGVIMNYKMKRSQVYIRPSTDIPFHTELDPTWIDRIRESTKEFSDDCQVDMEYIGNKFLKVNFWLPQLEDYLRMTDSLYVKGEVKEAFKDAMKHTKSNRIAFAMSSWHLDKRNESGLYVKEWYTNKKTRPESKFLEEVKETLDDRMYAFRGYMSLPDCIMNSAIYDYDHKTKHSYFLYLKRDQETELQIDDIRKNASSNYAYKRKFNQHHGVEAIISKNVTTVLEYHDFHDIPAGIFDSKFNSLNIPIL
jgi:hypothetical protein